LNLRDSHVADVHRGRKIAASGSDLETGGERRHDPMLRRARKFIAGRHGGSYRFVFIDYF
jgi:hypothetical protein